MIERLEPPPALAARDGAAVRSDPHTTNRVWAIAGLVLAYFLAGRFGLLLAISNPSATLVWPPAGIALASLIVLGLRVWPGVFLGAFAVNATLSGHVLSSLGIAAGNTLEGVAGAWLVSRFAGGSRVFDNMGQVFRFALLAPVLSTTISASVGVASLSLAQLVPGGVLAATWIDWWVGDAVGQLLVAPCLILWWRRHPAPRRSPREATAAAVSFLGPLLIGWIVFGGWAWSGEVAMMIKFLCFPAVVWAAFKLRQHETALAILGMGVISVWGATNGLGGHATEVHRNLLIFQMFMGTAALTGLVISAAVAGRDRDQAELRRARDELETRVTVRTAELQSSLAQQHDAETALVRLSRRLLRLRDEERHRIAQGLHEGIAQMLGALQMHLGTLERRLTGVLADRDRSLLLESAQMVRDCSDEVRTMSYLLHPPLLDEEGLSAAVAPYLDGFTRRSGIQVEWTADAHLERMPSEVEISIFRILQECLTNVYRHSGSQRAAVRLERSHDTVTLVVVDHGTGMASGVREGLGIPGMRERVGQLGGTLQIESGEQGTTVRAAIPVDGAPPG